MFWGLIMEPNKRYTQTVEKSFHVSMASLDLTTADMNSVQVMVCYDSKNYLLCTLKKDSNWQVPLDLNFQEGTKIAFTCNGQGHVHLTGYLILDEDLDLDELEEEEEDDEEQVPQLVNKQSKRKALESPKADKKSKRVKQEVEAESSDDDDLDIDKVNDEDDLEDSEEDEEESLVMEEQEEDDSDEDEEDEEDEEEDEEMVQKKTTKPQQQEKKNKQVQQQQQQKNKQEKHKLVNGKETKPEQQTKQQKKKKAEQLQQQQPQPQQQQQQQQQQQNTQNKQKKRVVEGGVQIEELKEGGGPPAEPGRFVSVYYIGRLKNGKKFDSTTQGDGFKFRLGNGEVIKGWDVGIQGMKVGGKRRITVPAAMAYGARGSPPVIPGNSTLIFEVELKKVFHKNFKQAAV